VIANTHEQGGYSPHWAAEPEKVINNNNNNNINNNRLRINRIFVYDANHKYGNLDYLMHVAYYWLLV
jgi:hypothetical protein